ncbi:hypothetical protein Tco_1561766 [Tanacetum coccineum]
MKEQAYNIIKTKDSRTQQQSNLTKVKGTFYANSINSLCLLRYQIKDRCALLIVITEVSASENGGYSDDDSKTGIAFGPAYQGGWMCLFIAYLSSRFYYPAITFSEAFLFLAEARTDKRHSTGSKWVLKRYIRVKDADVRNNGFLRYNALGRLQVLDTFLSWTMYVKWNDVAGLLSAKQALQEFVILPIKFSQFFVGLLFSILITGVLTNAIKDATR